MRVSVVLIVLALLLTFSVSSYAMDTKCVVVGPAASDLSLICPRGGRCAEAGR